MICSSPPATVMGALAARPWIQKADRFRKCLPPWRSRRSERRMTSLPLVLRIRDELLAKYPAEFRHGYLSGYTGENQPPCDAAGYMIGHHTWPLERKNAWFAGWNLGNCEAPE
jgi:hypothetical protein